jgi:hypothetical protein
MRKHGQTVLVALFLAICVHSFGQADNQRPSFTIQIHLRQATIKVGSPVILDIQVINNSDTTKSISVSPGIRFAPGYYESTVLDAKNNAMAETSYGQRMHGRGDDPKAIGGGSHFQAPIEPGGHLDQEYELSRLYRITDPGIYTIQLRRNDLLGGGKSVKSNVVVLTVTE